MKSKGEEMRFYYFTSTGNSLYVSKKNKRTNRKLWVNFYTKALKEKNFSIEDIVIGFVYSIHCGSLSIVVEFISKLDIKDKKYIFAIGVTGCGEAKKVFHTLMNF